MGRKGAHPTDCCARRSPYRLPHRAGALPPARLGVPRSHRRGKRFRRGLKAQHGELSAGRRASALLPCTSNWKPPPSLTPLPVAPHAQLPPLLLQLCCPRLTEGCKRISGLQTTALSVRKPVPWACLVNCAGCTAVCAALHRRPFIFPHARPSPPTRLERGPAPVCAFDHQPLPPIRTCRGGRR